LANVLADVDEFDERGGEVIGALAALRAHGRAQAAQRGSRHAEGGRHREFARDDGGFSAVDLLF